MLNPPSKSIKKLWINKKRFVWKTNKKKIDRNERKLLEKVCRAESLPTAACTCTTLRSKMNIKTSCFFFFPCVFFVAYKHKSFKQDGHVISKRLDKRNGEGVSVVFCSILKKVKEIVLMNGKQTSLTKDRNEMQNNLDKLYVCVACALTLEHR